MSIMTYMQARFFHWLPGPVSPRAGHTFGVVESRSRPRSDAVNDVPENNSGGGGNGPHARFLQGKVQNKHATPVEAVCKSLNLISYESCKRAPEGSPRSGPRARSEVGNLKGPHRVRELQASAGGEPAQRAAGAQRGGESQGAPPSEVSNGGAGIRTGRSPSGSITYGETRCIDPVDPIKRPRAGTK
jgi:hypothetical protein